MVVMIATPREIAKDSETQSDKGRAAQVHQEELMHAKSIGRGCYEAREWAWTCRLFVWAEWYGYEDESPVEQRLGYIRESRLGLRESGRRSGQTDLPYCECSRRTWTDRREVRGETWQTGGQGHLMATLRDRTWVRQISLLRFYKHFRKVE